MNIYVLFVVGKCEQRIKEYINAYTSHEAFVPVIVKLMKRKAILLKQEQMLFPGYVFVRSDLDANAFKIFTQHHLIPLTGFIRLLIYREDGVSTLSHDEVKSLQPFFANKGVLKHSKGFIEQDRVVVTEGPLMGLESQIKFIDRHKKMAIVAIPLFNEIKEVKVSLEILSKVT